MLNVADFKLSNNLQRFHDAREHINLHPKNFGDFKIKVFLAASASVGFKSRSPMIDSQTNQHRFLIYF